MPLELFVAILLAGGFAAGFLTGLLGLGGGIVMVPLIYQCYVWKGFAGKPAFTTAVASSLAVIIFSGTYASWLHYKADRLDMKLVTWMGAGAIAGAYLGSYTLVTADNSLIRVGFGLFLWLVAAALFLPKAEPRVHGSELTALAKLGLIGMGAIMGTIAAMFGVGGAALAVPALVVLFGVAIHLAIAAASSMIVITALFSTTRYIWLGYGEPMAPSPGLGWVDPTAVVCLLPGALLATRFGVKLAQTFSRERLRNALVALQILVGARFVFF